MSIWIVVAGAAWLGVGGVVARLIGRYVKQVDAQAHVNPTGTGQGRSGSAPRIVRPDTRPGGPS